MKRYVPTSLHAFLKSKEARDTADPHWIRMQEEHPQTDLSSKTRTGLLFLS